jgi:hypothetical protein
MAARFRSGDAPMRRFGPLYWEPRRLVWWVGALFMIGSSCFMAGPVVAATNDPATAGVIFFVGSLFFTSAAYLQYVDLTTEPGATKPAPRGIRRLLHFEPRRVEWHACTVQLAGTLLFNVSTFSAMNESLTIERAERLVWAPDALGSICFLVASYLAWAEARGAWWGGTNTGLSVTITRINLAGSLAFGISALASYVVPDTGELLNAAVSSAWTFIGAACFFAGAYLLWPEANRSLATPAAAVP